MRISIYLVSYISMVSTIMVDLTSGSLINCFGLCDEFISSVPGHWSDVRSSALHLENQKDVLRDMEAEFRAFNGDKAVLEEIIAKKDIVIAKLNTTIAEQYITIKERDTTIARRDITITAKDAMVSKHNITITEQGKTIEEFMKSYDLRQKADMEEKQSVQKIKKAEESD
ncbi:hypothetical protein C7974DRAFT_417871 [Boeremia exigua]|uniref:uncharacterized protein n=1 Tax=Boeremia exigua TaxID=749465 RepID=UPI001E8EEF41|nr:uncharacterized protein C7974DRAFT_417871 [Boeremia exigua]KAH6614138.1 hypothetical protein C7974DRAFT_417871 [Boeremia exigua]